MNPEAFTTTSTIDGRLRVRRSEETHLFTSAVSRRRMISRNSAEYFLASLAGKVKRPAMSDRVSIFPSTDSKGVEKKAR